MNEATTSTIALPPFGAYIAGQGGHLAAIIRGANDEPYALIVAPQATENKRCTWGPYGKELKAGASRTDGAANTAAMLKAGCSAATAIAQVEVDGHKDFFLPALGQLNAAAANVPELFDAKGVYWTSTQYSRNLAFVQDFVFGRSYWYGKGSVFRVRAFRMIPLHLLNA